VCTKHDRPRFMCGCFVPPPPEPKGPRP
jgi:hypothetical protein